MSNDIHDIQIEQALLGALFIDNQALSQIGGLSAEDFFDQLHAQIFEAVRLAIIAGGVVTPLTIAPKFAKHPTVVDGLTVKAYLGRLAVNATSTASASSYATIIRELSARRKFVRLSLEINQLAGEPNTPLADAARTVQQKIDEVLGSAIEGKRNTRKLFSEASASFIDSLSVDDSAERIPTGFVDLDKVTGGWRRGQLVLLAGRPSMGKTTVGVSALTRSAMTGRGCLFLSLEMSMPEIMARMHTDLAWSHDRSIQYSHAMSGKMNQGEIEHLARASSQYAALPMIVDDATNLTVVDIAMRVRREKAALEKKGQRLDVVMIDHLGKIKPMSRYSGNKVAETGEISGALKNLAKDLDVAVIALNQLNRGTENRDNKRPVLSDLRNSGDLEQDADLVVFTFRESYYHERARFDVGSQQEFERQTLLEATRHSMELVVAKNRNGPCLPVNLFVDMGCNVVRDAA